VELAIGAIVLYNMHKKYKAWARKMDCFFSNQALLSGSKEVKSAIIIQLSSYGAM
jgi:hypothetical protein